MMEEDEADSEREPGSVPDPEPPPSRGEGSEERPPGGPSRELSALALSNFRSQKSLQLEKEVELARASLEAHVTAFERARENLERARATHAERLKRLQKFASMPDDVMMPAVKEMLG